MAWKIPVTCATYGFALFTAISRVIDRKHEVIDITAGSIAGSLIALFVYNLQEKNIFRIFYRDDASEEIKVDLKVQSNSIAFVYRF